LAAAEVQEPLVVQVKMAGTLYFRHLQQSAAAAAVVTIFLLQIKPALVDQAVAPVNLTPVRQLQEAQEPLDKATKVAIGLYQRP
jgi:hypothetical protein